MRIAKTAISEVRMNGGTTYRVTYRVDEETGPAHTGSAV